MCVEGECGYRGDPSPGALFGQMGTLWTASHEHVFESQFTEALPKHGCGWCPPSPETPPHRPLPHGHVLEASHLPVTGSDGHCRYP